MLFPVERLAEPPPKGIARLAAEAAELRAKDAVEYFELSARGVLNRCSSARMPFEWTINPYRGCEFGCRYCYARYTHEFMGLEDGRDFEGKIYVKRDAARILAAELRKRPAGAIAIGTATDPYQPAERRFEVTRSLLQVLASEAGRSISIVTKSDLIVRDVEPLRAVARRNRLTVAVTVTTVDVGLARKLEPRAPRPDLRLRAVEALTRAGLDAGVLANPVMPFLTDSAENLGATAAAAARAGARFFGGGSLFLMPSARRQFFPFLEAEFPEAAARCRELYRDNAYLRGPYTQRIRERVQAAATEHGLPPRPPRREPPTFQRPLPLFD